MAEELTSGFDASAAPSPESGGQAWPTSGGTPQGPQTDAPAQAAQAQPAAPEGQQAGQPQQTATPSKVNLFESAEFRQWQAAQERQQAELRKALEASQAQMEQYATANMDDFQRAQWEKEKFKRIAEQREQALAQMQQDFQVAQLNMQRQQDLQALAQQYGVQPSQLEGARTYEEAKLLAEVARYRQAEAQQRATTNRPDLGGGRANTPTDRLESEFERAVRTRDPVAYMRLLSRQQGGG